MHPIKILVITQIIISSLLNQAFSGSTQKSSCLYAFNTGEEEAPVYPCNEDIMNILNNNHVSNVINLFGLNSSFIKFRGCRSGVFSVHEPVAGLVDKYTISYPLNLEEKINYNVSEEDAFEILYLASIIHEISHVLQMKSYGGLNGLYKENENSSLRIELGADYLTGHIFSKLKLEANLFQHTLAIKALYFELNKNAHGDPEQRMTAFRRGLYSDKSLNRNNIREIHDDFQNDIFGTISK